MYIFGHHFYCLCVFSTRMMASLCVFSHVTHVFSHVTLWPQCDQEPSVLFTFYRSALFQSRSTSLSGHTIGQQKPHGQNIWNVGSLIYFTHSFISIPTNAADFFFSLLFFLFNTNSCRIHLILVRVVNLLLSGAVIQSNKKKEKKKMAQL